MVFLVIPLTVNKKIKFSGTLGKVVSINNANTYSNSFDFNANGSKLYSVGAAERIYQFSLSENYNINTATYGNVFFNAGGQDNLSYGIRLSSDGFNAYLAGDTNNRIFQYAMTTAFDVSTMSYSGKSFLTTSETSSPQDVSLNTNGTKMYVLDGLNDIIYQYTLATPYDANTAIYDTKSLDLSPQNTSNRSFGFNSDGTKFYSLGASSTKKVYQYSMATAFDISTATYDGVFFAVNGVDLNITGVRLSNSDNSLYLTGRSYNRIAQFDLTIAGDISSVASKPNTIDLSSIDSDVNSSTFNSTGDQVFLLGSIFEKVYNFYLAEPFNLNGATNTGKTLDLSLQDTDPESVTFSANGDMLFILGNTNDNIYKYSLTTNFDISTATYDTFFDVSGQDANAKTIVFNNDGTKLYMLGYDSDLIFQYNLTIAYDLASAVDSGFTLNVTNEDFQPSSFRFNNDGSKLFYLGFKYDSIFQYNLSVSFDISSATYSGISNGIGGSYDTYLPSLCFSNDGINYLLLEVVPKPFINLN